MHRSLLDRGSLLGRDVALSLLGSRSGLLGVACAGASLLLGETFRLALDHDERADREEGRSRRRRQSRCVRTSNLGQRPTGGAKNLIAPGPGSAALRPASAGPGMPTRWQPVAGGCSRANAVLCLLVPFRQTPGLLPVAPTCLPRPPHQTPGEDTPAASRREKAGRNPQSSTSRPLIAPIPAPQGLELTLRHIGSADGMIDICGVPTDTDRCGKPGGPLGHSLPSICYGRSTTVKTSSLSAQGHASASNLGGLIGPD